MRVILVTAVLIGALACGGSRSPEEVWTTADYTRAGAPSLDETWGATELVRAVDGMKGELHDEAVRLAAALGK